MRNSPLAPINVWRVERLHARAHFVPLPPFPLSFFSCFSFLFLSIIASENKQIFNIETRSEINRFLSLFSLFFFFFFSFSPLLLPLLPFLPAYSPIVPSPIALQRSGDDVSIHAFTLISPPYLVLLAFHPYVEDVPILVVSQPNGSYEILRHRFPPGNRVFSIQGREFNSTILWMPRAFPFRSLSPSLSLSSFSREHEKLEGLINSVASGEASRLCEQRDPGKSACIRDRA